MKERVNRNSFPRSGDYLAFLKFYLGLDKDQRSHIWVGAAKDTPGSFNFCVFPAAVSLPPEAEDLLKPAKAVAELVDQAAVGRLEAYTPDAPEGANAKGGGRR